MFGKELIQDLKLTLAGNYLRHRYIRYILNQDLKLTVAGNYLRHRYIYFMNLFIDTNVYLNFFHYSEDDFEELEKLITAIDNNALKLYITEQVKNEFARNRENKLSESLRHLKSCKVPVSFPRVCQKYSEYSALRTQGKAFQETLENLILKLEEESRQHSLGADKLIRKLFEKAITLPIDDDSMKSAVERVRLGNPPGKSDSIGDAINWECLLKHFPNQEELSLITADQDFISKIDDKNLKDFLIQEWNMKKLCEIKHYNSLSEFFKNKFPNITLATELEKQLAIDALIGSGSFRHTHLAVTKLNNFLGSFSNDEINQIISGARENPQVFRIKDDPDIKDFFTNLAKINNQLLLPENQNFLEEWYPPAQIQDRDENDVPI